MQAVNTLIQEVYEALNMTGLGEDTDGTMAQAACQDLNRVIANLNSLGYISLSQDSIDRPPATEYVFMKLQEGETPEGNVIDMEPPEQVDGVSRKIGTRFVPLVSMDSQQMAMINPHTRAVSWTYGRHQEDGPEGPRMVGTLKLSGRIFEGVRIWYTSKLPKYTLDDRIYLSDLYNNLLFTGLKFELAKRFELSDSKKAECETDFRAAKSLIKRNNITQRMIVSGGIGSDWRDSYANGIAGNGF